LRVFPQGSTSASIPNGMFGLGVLVLGCGLAPLRYRNDSDIVEDEVKKLVASQIKF
jgi:hypothetical protein